jgi:hypothetical protein
MKISCHVVASVPLFGITANSASGGPIQWSLSPVNLQGCCIPPLNQQQGLASGTFSFDWDTQTYTDWSLHISGYTSPLEHLNAVLTPATSSVSVGGSTFLDLTYAGNVGDLVLEFGYLTTFGVIDVPLTSFGGTVPVLVTNSSRLVSFSAFASDGSASSVPEPAAGVLVLVSAAILCLWKPGSFCRKAKRDVTDDPVIRTGSRL